MQPKVIVIGAGLAGLTAAYRLHQEGINVELYEARQRVGGRVFSVNLGDRIAELGAQSIGDGGKAENFLCLVKEFDLELIQNQVSIDRTFMEGDHLISTKELFSNKKFSPEQLREQIDQLAATSHNLREILDKIVNPNDLLNVALSVRIAAFEGAPPEKLSTFYTDTLYHMLLGGICHAHQKGTEEENLLTLSSLKKGNTTLPEKMAEILGSHLHLGMPLAKVAKKERSYALTFQNGQTALADFLILAIPCSVYENIAFDKDIIPQDRLEAIQSIKYGVNAKILIHLPHLPTKVNGFINRQITSFYNRQILCLYFINEASRFDSHTIQSALQQGKQILEKGFGLSSSFSPVCAEDRAFTSYEKAVGHSWPLDPYAKGSYSYISPGQEKLINAIHDEHGEPVKTLFAPIDQRLYFAGEHTSILTQVPGTMEAACESGERMARLIHKQLSLS